MQLLPYPNKENGTIIEASEQKRNEESDERILIDQSADPTNLKFFEFGAIRFIWNNSHSKFQRQTALDQGNHFSYKCSYYPIKDLQLIRFNLNFQKD